ncbi:putative transporter small subunit [Brevibacterium litoralis]
MSIAALTVYVLMWPAIVAVVLGVVSVSFFRDLAKARKDGHDII